MCLDLVGVHLCVCVCVRGGGLEAHTVQDVYHDRQYFHIEDRPSCLCECVCVCVCVCVLCARGCVDRCEKAAHTPTQIHTCPSL